MTYLLREPEVSIQLSAAAAPPTYSRLSIADRGLHPTCFEFLENSKVMYSVCAPAGSAPRIPATSLSESVRQ